jgi:hypothetical protein
MKLTVTIYQAKAEEKRNAYYQMTQAEENDNMPLYFELKEKYEALQAWFDALPKVSVSFMIGYRSYYREVVRIGKTFFDGRDKMTKGNGYRSIEVIPAITEEMKAEMISDSYYY